jgi:hypothetical protein
MGVMMEKLVLIKNFPDRAFAEQAKQILKQNDIGCVLKSADVGILGSATSSLLIGVDLYVDETQAIEAGNLINAIFDGI